MRWRRRTGAAFACLRCGLEYRWFWLWTARRSAGNAVALDLDNTFVDTGLHLARGASLAQAADLGEVIVGVKALLDGLQTADPHLVVFVLSARPYAMRAATETWLQTHWSGGATVPVFLVPSAQDKVRYWWRARR